MACLASAPSDAPAAGITVGHSGWFWGDTIPQGNDLTGVDVLGKRAYAVGGFGTVLRSDDGGASWVGLRSGTTTDLNNVQAITAQSVVVSGGCEVRRSDDSGRTFRWLALAAGPACGDGVQAVTFPTTSVGYVMTLDGGIRATADGGRSFERRTRVPAARPRMRNQGVVADATDLLFTGPATGLATTRDGRIFRTTDGARKWTPVVADGAPLNGLTFLDAETGFAVGGGRRALKTADGGRTWSPVSLSGAPAVDLGSISCADPQTCLIVPALPEFAFDDPTDYALRTTDGGATARTISPSRLGLSAADLDSSGRAVAVGLSGMIAASENLGAQFILASDTGANLTTPRMRAGSPRRVYAFDPRGSVVQSTDGGTTWTSYVVPRSNLVDGAFPTGRKGFVLTSGGKLRTTEDGGKTWRTLPGRGRRRSQALIAFDERHLLVVGRGVRRSTDGGRSLRKVRSQVVRYSDLTRADRAGNTVVVWHEDGSTQPAISHDRGRTWRRLNRPRGISDFFELDFVSRRVGFLVDTTLVNYRRVFVTRNAGSALPALGANGIGNIAFSDRLNGYVEVDSFVESRPEMLRTSDGGQSWRPQPVTPGTASDLVAPTPRRAYAYIDELVATATGGDFGAASRIVLDANRRQLRPGGVVTIRGRLRPSVAGARVRVSRRLGTGWQRRELRTDGQGRFSSRWRVPHTAAFVAQWTGDGRYRAAGTRELRVTVRPAGSNLDLDRRSRLNPK